MARLGTWDTWDCPTEHAQEAKEWLQAKFQGIGGNVRRVMNSHDFGPYPSFEIDIPAHLDRDEDSAELDAWVSVIEGIEKEYSEKFSEWL